MSLPTFLVIGAARSGTTALTHFLRQHPEVFICNPKEPHFMAFAGRRVAFHGPGDDVTMNNEAITDYGAYQKLFRNHRGARAIGEGSVSTLYYYEPAIPNIRRYAPDTKLVVILRNPLDRAYSSFLYMTARGFEPLAEFEQALDEEHKRIEQGWHHIWHYTRMGLYSAQLQAFLEAFGPQRLKVLLYEDFNQHTTRVLAELYAYLGVRPDFRPDTSQILNRSGKPRNRLAHNLITSLGRTTTLKQCIKAVVPTALREEVRNWNLARPAMSNDARLRLREVFRADVQQLATLLGRRLDHWLA
jgi:Sulfotransferase family